jgi:hypothetical protein
MLPADPVRGTMVEAVPPLVFFRVALGALVFQL